MAALKDIGSAWIDERSLNKTIVYLESEEDIQIVAERWFFDAKEKVEFKSADEGSGGGGTSVINKVKEARREGVTAFGVIDRDVLLQQQQWDLWWEADDDVLDDAQIFGECIHVLHRWEIENYLLQVDALECVLADKEGRSEREKGDALKAFLDDMPSLSWLAAAHCFLHEKGKKFPGGFGQQEQGDALHQLLCRHLDKHGVSDAAETLVDYKKKVDAFAHGAQNDEQQWQQGTRLLDGKRVLKRLGLSDYRYSLARWIKQEDTVDAEWQTVVASMAGGSIR